MYTVKNHATQKRKSKNVCPVKNSHELFVKTMW